MRSAWLVILLAFLVQPGVRVQPPTAADRFAVKFELCQQALAADKPDKCRLFGKIQVVDSFPDVKVRKVGAFPDLKVQWVDAFPNKSGRWQKVSAFPDVKVQFVDAFADYDVQFVEAIPGCR